VGNHAIWPDPCRSMRPNRVLARSTNRGVICNVLAIIWSRVLRFVRSETSARLGVAPQPARGPTVVCGRRVNAAQHVTSRSVDLIGTVHIVRRLVISPACCRMEVCNRRIRFLPVAHSRSGVWALLRRVHSGKQLWETIVPNLERGQDFTVLEGQLPIYGSALQTVTMSAVSEITERRMMSR